MSWEKEQMKRAKQLLHTEPALSPRRQYPPGGHKVPVLLSLGLGTVAWIKQRNPGAQGPEGSESPSEPQK